MKHHLKHIFYQAGIVINALILYSDAGSISGRIVNMSNAALADAVVYLASDPSVRDTTGTDGKFTLNSSSVSIENYTKPGDNAPFSLSNKQITCSLTKDQKTAIRVYSPAGKIVTSVFSGIAMKGTSHFSFDVQQLGLSTGWYLLSLECSDLAACIPITIVGSSVFSCETVASGTGSIPLKTAQRLNASTLFISKKGYNFTKRALNSLETQNVGDIKVGVRSYTKSNVNFTSTTCNNELHPLVLLLPSDYDALDSLPALYLFHGISGAETDWTQLGNAQTVFSETYAKDSVTSMVVVIPDCDPRGSDMVANGPTADLFLTELRKDIIPFIEKNYHVSQERFDRAVAGLSAGGIQTWNLTLFYPEMWGYSFPMSTGFFPDSLNTFKKNFASMINVGKVNELKLLEIGNNPPDVAYANNKQTMKMLDSLGIHYTYTELPSGGHTWTFWTAFLRIIIPKMFR
jgi:enterochelin esterase-like enzyme